MVADKVRQLRDRETSNEEFLRLAGEISGFVGYEALRSFATRDCAVTTPVSEMPDAQIFDDQVVIVPILRAGLGMSAAVQSLVPNHRLCLMGLRRDEATLEPHLYLDGIPHDLNGAHVLVCDPMLATGGSLDYVLSLVRQRNPGRVMALCLIAAQPGVDRIRENHPDVTIVTAALDAHLNDVGYITPGLGDAGDRLFGPPVH